MSIGFTICSSILSSSIHHEFSSWYMYLILWYMYSTWLIFHFSLFAYHLFAVVNLLVLCTYINTVGWLKKYDFIRQMNRLLGLKSFWILTLI